jgi:hypothetical protein
MASGTSIADRILAIPADMSPNGAWGRYATFLPDTDDVSLVVLKGHLILEELLLALVERHCFNPNSLAKARLSFAQITYVAQAIFRLPESAPWWEPIRQLNTLRNSLVHQLQPNELEKKVNELYSLCWKSRREVARQTEPSTLSQKTTYSVIYLMGQLAALDEIAKILLDTTRPQTARAC